MIKGASHWDDRNRFYVQRNNAVESVLERYEASSHIVTCGPTATVNALDAIGADLLAVTPAGWTPQPEDVLTLWYHDARNWPTLAKIRRDTDPKTTEYSAHEVAQYIPHAVKSVFAQDCTFEFGARFEQFARIVSEGAPVIAVLRLKTGGHYVTFVAYDEAKDELIYHDPLGDWAQRMNRQTFTKIVDEYRITFQASPNE